MRVCFGHTVVETPSNGKGIKDDDNNNNNDKKTPDHENIDCVRKWTLSRWTHTHGKTNEKRKNMCARTLFFVLFPFPLSPPNNQCRLFTATPAPSSSTNHAFSGVLCSQQYDVAGRCEERLSSDLDLREKSGGEDDDAAHTTPEGGPPTRRRRRPPVAACIHIHGV